MTSNTIVHFYARSDAGKDGWFPIMRFGFPFDGERGDVYALDIASVVAFEISADVRVLREDKSEIGISEFIVAKEKHKIEAPLKDPLDGAEIAKIRDRLFHAPSGPWFEEKTNRDGRRYRLYAVPGIEWKDDATGGLQEFIANSITDTGKLLDEIDRLQALLDLTLQGMLKDRD